MYNMMNVYEAWALQSEGMSFSGMYHWHMHDTCPTHIGHSKAMFDF